MKPKVYIETSVISYLTARASRDVVVAARQAITQEWWEGQRERFDVFISELVEQEIAQGDPVAAALRAEKAAIIAVVESCGFNCPALCSPEELGGTDHD